MLPMQKVEDSGDMAALMFVLRSHCSSSLHHNPIGKLGGREANIDLKQDLYVWTALSAGQQCLLGAEYCKLFFGSR